MDLSDKLRAANTHAVSLVLLTYFLIALSFISSYVGL